MRKKSTILVGLLFVASVGFAQVKVASNGNVGVGTTSPITKFQIGDIFTFYDGGGDKEICRNARWANDSYWRIKTGVSSLISFTGTGDMLFKTAPSGTSGTAINNWNNVIIKSNGNVGIGTTSPTQKLHVVGNSQFRGTVRFDDWTDILLDWTSGICCGTPTLYPENNWYMQLGTPSKKIGDVYATNVLSNSFTTQPCDENAKENIIRIDNAIERIKHISGYRYNVKKEFFEKFSEEAIPNLTKPTFGFIAQELEKVFPEIVVKPRSKEEAYGVNYMEMIPVLLEAIKEQQTMIETLQKEIKSLQAIKNTLKSEEGATTQEFVFSNIAKLELYQNIPNPFNERTTVKCYVPEQFQKVQLCVYNMQGVQVQCLNIIERGSVSIEIEAGVLSAGIYSYVLLADGTASETKQMILTK